MTAPRFKAVIFDSGGVLHEHTSIAADVARGLGIDLPLMSTILSALVPDLELGNISEETFWARAHIQFHVRAVSTSENLLGRLFTGPKTQPRQRLFATIAQLKAQGLSVAVCSNTIEPHARVLARTGVYTGFDAVILSHRVHLRKPDAAIYLLTARRLSVKPSDCIFVDDLSENLVTAKNLGMDIVHATSENDVIARLARLTGLNLNPES